MLTKVVASLDTNSKQDVDSTTQKAILTFLLGEASKSQVRVASGREENKRRELLEKVLELDPKAARAALELAKYYLGTFRNPTESDRYARLAVSLAPKWVEARVFAARVAGMKGLDGEIERELKALLKEFPSIPPCFATRATIAACAAITPAATNFSSAASTRAITQTPTPANAFSRGPWNAST